MYLHREKGKIVQFADFGSAVFKILMLMYFSSPPCDIVSGDIIMYKTFQSFI